MTPVRTDDPDFIDRLLEQNEAFRRLAGDRQREVDEGRVSTLEDVRRRLDGRLVALVCRGILHLRPWTDFREAFAAESWLIWLKAANLLALIRLRERCYPVSKLY